MNNNSREQVMIDLKSNPLISRFFAGWTPTKAISFAQNLLIIGIGVANKLLINNTPEEAFNKLNKMAQNVSMQYQNLNKYGSSPNIYLSDEAAQQYRSENTSRKKYFDKNQQQHQYNFNDNNDYQDQALKQKLKNEYNQVKNQIEMLNQRLDQHPQHHQNQYISASPDYLEDNQDLNQTQRGRRTKKTKQKITPKITESPPPPQQITVIRNISGPKPHLNDGGIKQCLQIDDEEDIAYPYQQNEVRRGLSPQQYQNNQPYISASNQFMRSSGMYNDYDMSSSKGMQQQQIKSPERLSDAYFSTGSNFRVPSKKDKKNGSKERLQKRNNHNLGASPKQRNTSQQLGSVRSDKKKPQYLQNVESRIKGNIQAHRDQFQNNQDQNQQQENENFEDFKYMMNEGNNQNNANLEKDEVNKNQEDGQNNQTTENNKAEENVVEMGVHFSKTAQKKYYEKLEKEKQKELQKEGEKKNQFIQQQQQQQQQLQNYQVQYNPHQQEQYYRSMAAAAGGYHSQSPLSHQNPISSQQLLQHNQNTLIGSDSNRMGLNGNQENIVSGPTTSQKNTIYGGYANGTIQDRNKKNMYENANSFLSSPLMRQFIEDDEDEDLNQNYENDQINQREDVREYDDFVYPFASPNNRNAQQNIYSSNNMKQSYINQNNPYYNSMQMDPWRQSTGSRVGFNQNPNSNQTSQNNFYNQQSIDSTFGGGVGPNQNSQQQLPSFNPSVEQQNYQNNPEAILSTNTASFRQQQQQYQKQPNKNTQTARNSQIQQQYPQVSNQKSLKFTKGNKQSGNNGKIVQNQNPSAQPVSMVGEDNAENVNDFEPRQSTFITTQYKYDSGQKNNSFTWCQQNQSKYPAGYRNEELFRESINNNSEFTLPSEEVQQYLKDQLNFYQK
ncbi:hypothetical protein ABPG74_005854 [Tetrahymena malaccensis]